jgi:GNAT superfamily N-acetyltransferase
MSQSIQIRRASQDDIEHLMDLYRFHLSSDNVCTVGEDILRSHWQAILANTMLYYFVADAGGKVVSTCNLTVVPNLTHNLKPYGLIENVVTHSDYRRLGLGRQVIEVALTTAWCEDCYKVMLLSGSSRLDAHRFYESVGFHGDKKKGYVAYPNTE